MKRMAVGVGCLLLACGGAWGQTPETRLEFEVASVKPAPPPSGNFIRMGMNGGPGTPDPGRINYEFVSLRTVLAAAYGVKAYQISGPVWLDSERFNMTAKVPPGTTKEQFSVMLQNLVADRFKLTLHRESKDLPAYALLVAKGGPKMKPAATEDPGLEAGAAAPGTPTFGRMPMGKDGFPQLPAGPGRGMAMMMMPGRAKLAGNGMTIARLAESLSQQLDRAVVDLTGLTGKYDVSLTFEPELNRLTMGMPGRGGPPPGAEGGPPGAVEREPAPNLFPAVQEQLGLKLQTRKIPAEILIVDHMEKTPIDN